ncbi:hypothetical protein SDIMI_v3c07010 [Spiroplasma diminutum CUAS-1]|uniref:Uncharacterized protein n=1 Tax=Spiroplasma diminutum CUAS-1 TaxID=1276221 RepID=S5MKA0_9MOLU|nr:hypothetical protein SDIMI_v3c07010 [Spiroplasma diminutum CUAS-1]
MIDNTQWINHIFLDKKNIYFTDSDLNNTNNNLCSISKTNFKENLNNKADLDRCFLAHPNPIISTFEMITKTDVSILHSCKYYIQNFVVVEDIKYISYIIENKVFTKKFLSDDELIELQIITVIENNLIIKIKEEFYLTDKNFKIIKKIDYKLVDVIKIKDNYVIQKENEEIILVDLDFKFEKIIDSDKGFKKIYYLNKTNILISYLKNEVTKIYNVFTEKSEIFQKSFLKRAILLDENTLIVKKNTKNIKSDMLNLIY